MVGSFSCSVSPVNCAFQCVCERGSERCRMRERGVFLVLNLLAFCFFGRGDAGEMKVVE